MAPLLHRAAIKKLQGKNIMPPLLHRAAIIIVTRKSWVTDHVSHVFAGAGYTLAVFTSCEYR